MKIKVMFLIGSLTIFFTQICFSQEEIPVVMATSTLVDIKEDHNLIKNAWTIAPEEKLDVYTTSAKVVTFYTDVDSISFKVKPHNTYNFIVLLNKKDSARTRIVWEPSRLDILKAGSKYNLFDNRFIPNFSYQSQENPNLIRIRKELKLDSIAGNGSELSQIFNLLHWADNVVEHDGSSSNPTLQNAIDLLKICKTENRGLNCRMLATFLNECYLAMGIKSRYVTCMPKETDFEDCHVINMVFSTDLNKWIWIDPTFGAYLMDGDGNLLGIEEVREKFINEEQVVLNADANWNRTYLQTKQHYLGFYMPKNLYRLTTPLISEYNAETVEKGKEISFVELIPLDALEQTPQKEVILNKESGVTRIYYKTNNPELFWAKPN